MASFSSEDRERLQAYLDNQLIAEESLRLQERLKFDPALAEELIRLGRDEAITAEWASGNHVPDAMPTVAQTTTFRRRLILATGIGTLALSVGLFALLNPVPVDRLPVNPVGDVQEMAEGPAHLEEIEGEAFLVSESGESTPLLAGQTIQPGQQLRTSEGGRAVILMPFVGRIELGADTTVRIMPSESEARVHIEQGTLLANSATQVASAPMSFTTPHALIKASGSTVITCGMGNTSTVEMGVGSASVTNMGDGKTINVTAGKIAVTKPRGQKPEGVKSAPPRTEKPLSDWSYPAGPTQAGMMVPGGNIYAFTTSDSRMIWRDLGTGREIAEVVSGKTGPHALDIAADGSVLLTGSNDKTPRVRETLTGRELIAFQKQKTEILAVALSPDGRTAATGGGVAEGKAEIRLWDVATGVEIKSLPGHVGNIQCLKFSPDGRWLACAGRDGAVMLWDTSDWRSVGEVTRHSQGALSVAFTPDSRTLISGGRDGFVRLWDISKQQLRAELDPPPREVSCLSVSRDGQRLAAGVGENIWIWDLATRLPMQTLAGHRSKVASVTFSPDGRTLISTGWDRTVKVWEVSFR